LALSGAGGVAFLGASWPEGELAGVLEDAPLPGWEAGGVGVVAALSGDPEAVGLALLGFADGAEAESEVAGFKVSPLVNLGGSSLPLLSMPIGLSSALCVVFAASVPFGK
jgi:hypothetical protein